MLFILSEKRNIAEAAARWLGLSQWRFLESIDQLRGLGDVHILRFGPYVYKPATAQLMELAAHYGWSVFDLSDTPDRELFAKRQPAKRVCSRCKHESHPPNDCKQRVCDAAGDMDWCPCGGEQLGTCLLNSNEHTKNTHGPNHPCRGWKATRK